MKCIPKLTWLLCLVPLCGWAETNLAQPYRPTGWVEAGFGHAELTSSLSSWNDVYLRGHVQLSPANSIQGEISNQRHFGDQGTFVGASWTHVLNDDWYGSLGVGSSDGGFFLPKVRVDAALYRKWLPQRRLVTGAVLGYYRAKDVHSDHSLVLNAVYYFDGPWIAEGGVRINESDPGNVITARGFAALTWGRHKDRYIVLRHDTGREGYQLISTSTVVSDFSSRETTLTWREWLSPKGGFNLTAGHYANPGYTRSGVSLGLFYEF